MEAWICSTCGTQFPNSDVPPTDCPICLDDRQYVGHKGQQWTTLGQLQRNGSRNSFLEHEPNLIGIGTVPTFAIGQRALLVRTPQGNILWDCTSFVDDITTELIRGLGGIQAIAISHPHYYSSMAEWAHRFDAKIYLHESDRKWVVNPNPYTEFWGGDERVLTDHVTLHRLGGHFPGGTVLQWNQGADGQGVLLTGDIIQVVADRKWVSFMHSYPNLIPLPGREVRRIQSAVEQLSFERVYGAWFETVVSQDAKKAVFDSAARYIHALES